MGVNGQTVPPDPRPPAILAEHLSRRYDDVLAVRDVNLRVAAGEVVALLGPNGAGKTTLLRMLAGILVPTEGRAVIAGHDVATDPARAKRALGFLSGDTALYGRLTVREVLTYFGRLYGLAPADVARRVTRVAELLELGPFLEQRAGTLSSGQTQRANLARTFLTDPPVLILDEPTTALDVVSGEFVYQAIQRARGEGRAILLSTHVMSEAERLADRIVLLVRGRVAAEGPRDALLAAHQAPSLTDLILRLHQAEAAS
jgi:sodium transport system ATP-binding protein